MKKVGMKASILVLCFCLTCLALPALGAAKDQATVYHEKVVEADACDEGSNFVVSNNATASGGKTAAIDHVGNGNPFALIYSNVPASNSITVTYLGGGELDISILKGDTFEPLTKITLAGVGWEANPGTASSVGILSIPEGSTLKLSTPNGSFGVDTLTFSLRDPLIEGEYFSEGSTGVIGDHADANCGRYAGIDATGLAVIYKNLPAAEQIWFSYAAPSAGNLTLSIEKNGAYEELAVIPFDATGEGNDGYFTFGEQSGTCGSGRISIPEGASLKITADAGINLDYFVLLPEAEEGGSEDNPDSGVSLNGWLALSLCALLCCSVTRLSRRSEKSQELS